MQKIYLTTIDFYVYAESAFDAELYYSNKLSDLNLDIVYTIFEVRLNDENNSEYLASIGFYTFSSNKEEAESSVIETISNHFKNYQIIDVREN